MTGMLLYDDRHDRFMVEELINDLLTDDSRVRDLHCGDCLTIAVKRDDWRETRIEKDLDDVFGWYFVGVGRAAPLIGHPVKIED